MSESGPESEVFEVARVKDLIELMRENDLSEIDLKHGERRIRLRRGDSTPPMMMAGYPQMPNYAMPSYPMSGPAPGGMAGGAGQAGPGGASASGSGGTAPADDAGTQTITSPMVGTFYLKPNPESKPYVQVGDSVSPETIVCQIEAMKMFSEIPAGVSGTITAILVKNEESVDVNKPLFKVR